MAFSTAFVTASAADFMEARTCEERRGCDEGVSGRRDETPGRRHACRHRSARATQRDVRFGVASTSYTIIFIRIRHTARGGERLGEGTYRDATTRGLRDGGAAGGGDALGSGGGAPATRRTERSERDNDSQSSIKASPARLWPVVCFFPISRIFSSRSPVAATRFRARRSARRRAVGVYGVHETPWVHVTHIARAELVMAAIVLGVGSCVWMRMARETRGVECWRRGSLGGEVVSRPLFWPTGGRPITARQMEIEDFSREILQATRRSGVNRSGSARGRLTPILNPDPEPSLSTHCNERRAPPAMPLSTSTQLERRTTINPSRPWISSVPDFYCWRTLVSYDEEISYEY